MDEKMDWRDRQLMVCVQYGVKRGLLKIRGQFFLLFFVNRLRRGFRVQNGFAVLHGQNCRVSGGLVNVLRCCDKGYTT